MIYPGSIFLLFAQGFLELLILANILVSLIYDDLPFPVNF